MTSVLIVDDNKDARDNLRALIKQQEPYWDVSEAASGKVALEVFRHLKPDVVVLDVVMDGINGVGVAYEMRQLVPDAKIIFISNQYTVRETSTLMRTLGVDAFVDKAHAVQKLLPTIKDVLRVA